MPRHQRSEARSLCETPLHLLCTTRDVISTLAFQLVPCVRLQQTPIVSQVTVSELARVPNQTGYLCFCQRHVYMRYCIFGALIHRELGLVELNPFGTVGHLWRGLDLGSL
ncbi:unnamed protein product [Protopolystoma xenopodis]|uniref:Uncharacterized protein n=1 Tax=Protopolystoma xenopodis TaxID=117903 RepID=A0A3S5A2T8_9PLAT|nr:unnamed protein product [Protopolystoma xenopodis]